MATTTAASIRHSLADKIWMDVLKFKKKLSFFFFFFTFDFQHKLSIFIVAYVLECRIRGEIV
jgi:hypothetical protein